MLIARAQPGASGYSRYVCEPGHLLPVTRSDEPVVRVQESTSRVETGDGRFRRRDRAVSTKPFEFYGRPQAERVIVIDGLQAIGSCEEVVDELLSTRRESRRSESASVTAPSLRKHLLDALCRQRAPEPWRCWTAPKSRGVAGRTAVST